MRAFLVALSLYNAATIFRVLATTKDVAPWLYILSVVAILCALWLAVSTLLREVQDIVRRERQ